MHSEQMQAEGPAMIFRFIASVFPQNEHFLAELMSVLSVHRPLP
jgi:hypothetical protein